MHINAHWTGILMNTIKIVNTREYYSYIHDILRVVLPDLWNHLILHYFHLYSQIGASVSTLKKKSHDVGKTISIPKIIWLVVSTPLKNMNVNWDDDIPNISGKIKNGNQTTNQIIFFIGGMFTIPKWFIFVTLIYPGKLFPWSLDRNPTSFLWYSHIFSSCWWTLMVCMQNNNAGISFCQLIYK